MEKSRVKNSINNAKSAMMMQLINKILAFVVRTVFIKILNTEYLGINGLFTNILTMLSVAELGIGTAIIFSMYKPIAENNQEKLKSLMKYYKKSYNIIGIVIFALGLCVIPFMGFLIKDVPNIKENITFIYLLFLCNTTISYFFTYKRSIIIAYQQESIISKIDSVCFLFKSIFEIIVLNVFRNYVIYLIISIIYTLVENLIVSRKAKTMFPFLKDKDVKALSNHEKKHIFLNVKSLVVYKIGSIIMSGTDNILISALINVYTVGLCSNYTMIINAIRSVITSAFNGITASVGNLNAEKDKDKKENVFYQITFINFWIYSFCTIALIILLDHFIKIWFCTSFFIAMTVAYATGAPASSVTVPVTGDCTAAAACIKTVATDSTEIKNRFILFSVCIR